MADRWIEISDFTPGIYADFHAGSVAGSNAAVLRNGAATANATYRCIGDPRGGLSPLPLVGGGSLFAAPTMALPIPLANLWPAMNAVYLVDALVVSDSNEKAPGALNKDNSPTVYTLWGALASRTGANPYGHVVLGRLFRGAGSTTNDFLWESSIDYATYNSPNTAAYIPGGNLTTYRSTSIAGGPPIPVINLVGGVMGSSVVKVSHTAAAINATEATWTTFDTDVSVNYPTGVALNFDDGFGFVHPNPTAPTGSGGYYPDYPASATSVGARFVVGHQGRMVILQRSQVNAGLAFAQQQDTVMYSPPLDIRAVVFTSGFTVDQWTDDNTRGVSTVAASAALDELFVLRDEGGALVIRGDLDNPTVTRLPHVQSTGHVYSTPVQTPIGLVYGATTGVFNWNGGDTSEHLSPQLDGDFWNPSTSTESFKGNFTRFAYWHPYVMAPNNWLMDTRTRSWWRFEQPLANGIQPFGCYGVDPGTGQLLCFPYKKIGSGAAPWYTSDPAILATSYQWQSQPLLETRDRLVTAEEVEIMVSPGANTNTGQTVMITLLAFDYKGVATSTVTTFTFSGINGPQPILLRADLTTALTGRYMQLRIAVDGNGKAAAKVLSVRLGIRDSNMPAKSLS